MSAYIRTIHYNLLLFEKSRTNIYNVDHANYSHPGSRGVDFHPLVRKLTIINGSINYLKQKDLFSVNEKSLTCSGFIFSITDKLNQNTNV
jgi:hypothetical protein